MAKKLSVQLAVEVKRAHNQGRLRSGELGGARSGKNTKYKLEQVRGDKVGWFNGDPCHDPTSDRTETPLTEDALGESRCWLGGTLKMFMRRIGTTSLADMDMA